MSNFGPDMENRADVMRRDAFIVGILGFGAANGMHFSPYYLPGLLLLEPFVKVTFFTTSGILTSYFTSLVISTLTVMISGVPAAIYERVMGLKESNATSFGIWFGGMALITLPTVMSMASRGGP